MQANSSDTKHVAAAVGHSYKSAADAAALDTGESNNEPGAQGIAWILEDLLARKGRRALDREEADTLRLESMLSERQGLKAMKARGASKTGSATGSDRPQSSKVSKTPSDVGTAEMTRRNLCKHHKAAAREQDYECTPAKIGGTNIPDPRQAVADAECKTSLSVTPDASKPLARARASPTGEAERTHKASGRIPARTGKPRS